MTARMFFVALSVGFPLLFLLQGIAALMGRLPN